MLIILIVVLLVLALGGLPAWNYHAYGWYPSSALFVVVIVLLVLVLMGRI